MYQLMIIISLVVRQFFIANHFEALGELLVSGQLLGAHLCFMSDGLHRVCGWTSAPDFVCVHGKPYGPGVPVGTGVLLKKGGGVIDKGKMLYYNNLINL